MIPISTLFIGLNGLIALLLTYIVVMERTRTRLWHGESKEDVAIQRDPLINPNVVAATVEKLATKIIPDKVEDYGALQRKVRAHGNFAEYVPLGLLFVIALELMHSPNWLIWLEGGVLTVARIAHAWGLITTYGPSIGRATGFYLTLFVYIIGSLACVYYGIQGVI
ncbi:MAPEG family protein [Brasilonema bromeliae]|uniref:Glutathione S-transferase n=1 Tax=Brasilonema bromeliae SPC951 TaxID=385972 RepID=A0ABX1PA92_9CYAN|nr:MAPEG family protein [Brasilonema bromeliae]NMG20898.1 glutathione S-transferase [Brasilonema bromeliae SPC951]